MEKQFWQGRWDQRQIGFHEGRPNELLVAHHAHIEGARRVLVPLAGKAADLAWLAERDHEVVGVEFVRRAIEEYFIEGTMTATKLTLGGSEAWSAAGVTLVCADFFAVSLEPADAIYDRAALVAVAPADRARYVEKCASLSRGPTLLIALSYDQTKMQGPPWSVDEAEVRALYAGRAIEELERRAGALNPRMREVGLDRIEETAYLIGPR